MSIRWGTTEEARPPAILESMNSTLTLALVIVLLALAGGLAAGLVAG